MTDNHNGNIAPEKPDLLEVIRASGVELSREGAVWTGDCPFHDDRNAALMVDSATGHWQCDGACQTGGDVVAWVVRKQGVNRDEAQESLGLGCEKQVASVDSDPVASDTISPTIELSSKGDDQRILAQVVDYYHQTLKQSPGALTYLQKRCINHPEAIERFRLGFCDRTLGTKLPLKNRKEGGAIRARLQHLGLLRSTGHELFRGSITIPIITDQQIAQIYGRKVTSNLRAGTPQHVMLPGAPGGFFNMDAVRVSDEVILCHSMIDALTFWCAGYRNVTCVIGVEGYPDELLHVIKQHGVKRLLIAFAATPEGDAQAETLAERLNVLGIDTYRIQFPSGMDANDYAVKEKSPHEPLGEVIRQAQWLGKGQEHDVATATESATEEIATCVENQDVSPAVVVEATSKASPQEETPEEPTTSTLPATAVPRSPTDLEVEIKDKELITEIDQRRYRIRGFEKNLSYDQLKLNLLVTQGEGLHVDTFDLYATKPRTNFIRQSAVELGVKEELIKKDLGRLLLKLELMQEQNIRETLTLQPVAQELSDKERKEALSLLEAPDLIDRLLADFQACGLVGEETNKLVAYLAVLSRKLDKPLAVMVQSTSAAGKSALMDAVLNLVPDEERVQYSAITGQSLFYMGNFNLRHKILAISEEEGASNAAYALKLLQSEGHLTIASTGKDPISGRHTTHEYRVDGPVMIFSTTTAIDVDEELLNRCLVLTVNEGQAQTEAIHQWQRYQETLDGLLANQARDDILRVHRNAQRLLKPLHVVNPYATQLTFLSDKTRTRRDHRKYLTLIRTIALLHQYQREVRHTYYRDREIAYVEVTLDDIALANRLAHEILGRSLDELPPQTRRLLTLIDEMVTERCSGSPGRRRDYRFSRRDIREYTGWGLTQLKVHLQRLEALEYLLIRQGGRGRQRVYELLYNSEGKDGSSFLMGLVDTDQLKKSDQTEVVLVSGRDQVGPKSAAGRSSRSDEKSRKDSELGATKVSGEESSSGRGMPPTPASHTPTEIRQGG
ncbi:CHC2 zinc finger domain-containing protein [Candidatus Thiodiazotropha sp. LNASS1]|uniref:CHC2 zinc finger domain-containing protein n=1 Tax=Candidatus Thiodiazotropha sp. LNASS1 TaxID=3096260 RepID=UPI0034DE3419